MKRLLLLLTYLLANLELYSQNLQYAFTNGFTSNNGVYCVAGDVDVTGATIISGITNNGIDFDPSSAVITCPDGMYIARYHSDGQFDWLFSLGLIGNQTPDIKSLCTDKDGNIFISGRFFGSADLDPSSDTSLIVNPSTTRVNIFIASYDSSGNYRWGFAVTSSNSSSEALALEVDSTGNVYVSGYIDGFNQALDFDPGPGITTIQSEAYEKFFVASYTNTGNFRWVIKARGASSTHCYGTAIAVGKNGICYVGGKFDGSCDFDPSPANSVLTTSASGSRIQPFIVRYDSSGNFLDVFTMPCNATATTEVIVDDICLSPDETKFAVAGSLEGGSYDFDPFGAYYIQGRAPFSGFAASYDTSFSLNAAWSITDTSSATVSYAYPRGIAFDTTGDILYAGVVFGSVFDFDPGPGTALLNVTQPCEGFVSRHDSAGNFIQFFAVDYAVFFDLTIDSATHSITVTGVFDASGTADMDPGPGSYILAPSFNSSLVVARYNTSPWIITAMSQTPHGAFTVFPIPASEELTLSFQEAGSRSLFLSDATGRIVWSGTSAGYTTRIDISKLAPGSYILQVADEDGVYRRTIIVE